MTPPARLLKPGLYAITDSNLLPGDSVLTAVEAAVRGGATLVQYRDKTSSLAERTRLAKSLTSLCQAFQVPLIINDEPELALISGASGVHLGQTDGDLPLARQQLGNQAILGATCHGDIALADSACRAGADYLAFGRFFQSSTKPGAPSAELPVLAAAKQFGRPLVAIGGITLENGANLIQAGADHLAVVGGLFDCDDIEQRARAFSELFQRFHPHYQSPQ
ncbi:thiamine phosphate synthase [Marinobacter caseinilyticus]|uniref:thiamine phosphate synthase n=1 Tax=Marinobacter caseinilyticus TaxID=2692195 RepID=UPI00140E404B|nr:thiamine phosphate synthase [Marinobacter caseinilyticus]